MASTALEFPFPYGRGRTARGSVAPAGSGSWDIRVEIDDRVVFTRHCTEWHRVERLCAELQWQAGTGDAINIIGTIAAQRGTVANYDRPILETELPTDGSRFEGIVPPVARRAIFACAAAWLAWALRPAALDDLGLATAL